MKFILFYFLFTYLIACTGEIEKEQSLEKKMNVIENPSTKTQEPQTNIIQEHISGNRETHISGGPSSTHISGQ